jgi:hypothetical protein
MMVPALTSYGFTGPQRAAGKASGRSTGGAAGRGADGRSAVTAWAVASAAAGTIDQAVVGAVPMPGADRSELPPRAVKDRASKATVTMGGAIAARSERSRHWAPRSASPSVLAGAGGDTWSVGTGLIRGVPRSPTECSARGPGPCRASARQPATVRGPSHVAVLHEPRALGPRGDEYDDDHDDEDGAANAEDSAIEPHPSHARRREPGGSAERVVVSRRCSSPSAFRRIVTRSC